MLDKIATALHVSPTVVVILLVIAALQIALQVYALIDLARRDRVEGGRKWVWVLAVALGNLPGTIAYLAVGRPPAKVDISRASSGANVSGDAAKRAVDVLYNPRDER